MDCCIVVKISRRSVAFWYQANGQHYSPLLLKGVAEVPLYFYVRDNQFEFGTQARDRFYRNDPDAYGDYFSLIRDPARHFILHESPKRIKQLLYYGIEQYLSHFLNTVLYKSDSIEAYRAELPLKFVLGPDLGEPERMLVAEMFKEAGYQTVCVMSYSNLLLEQLRDYGAIDNSKAALVLTGLDDTLYAELYTTAAETPVKSLTVPKQGADPRIRILAGMILSYIIEQQPYLVIDHGAELSALLPYCAGLLDNPPMILTGEAELTTGDKCWFRVNLSKVEDSLQYYSGDLAGTTAISDLLQQANLVPGNVVVLLTNQQIQTPYFLERLLKPYPDTLSITNVLHDQVMESIFRKTVQTISPVVPNLQSDNDRDKVLPTERPKLPPPLPPQTGVKTVMPPMPPAKKQNELSSQPPDKPLMPPPLPPFKKKYKSNHSLKSVSELKQRKLTHKIMPIQLQKKVPVSLIKVDSSLQKIVAGLGWDPATENGHSVDLDLSLFMMGVGGKLLTEEYFIFYNNPASPDGAAIYPGDSRAGEGDGDDEIIRVDFSRTNPGVEFLYFAVTIDQSEERGHHFGHVKNAYIRIINAETNNVLCEYQLNEHFSGEDSLLIATISRNGGAWDLEAIGQAFTGGLSTLVDLYQ